MLSLNSEFYKPFGILIGVLLLPVSLFSVFYGLKNFSTELLIAGASAVLIYLFSLICCYKVSKSKNNYLVLENNTVIIHYPNITGSGQLKINIQDIVEIKLYKIASLKAWLLLASYVLPKSAYITYLQDGVKVCKHIGYPKPQELMDLFENSKIAFLLV